MSVSKWRYTSACDGQPCPGDCDNCGWEPEEDELISRKEAIDALMNANGDWYELEWAVIALKNVPSAEQKIIRCKDCKYGKQDEDGWWFCIDLDCQMGDKDGNGFCSDAERRTDDLQ